MTRFGVMKPLKLLEEAGLVVTRRQGREKLHFLNPIPIRLVHDRWVSKYAERWAAALSDLETKLETPLPTISCRKGANPQLYGGWPMILSGLKTWLETGQVLITPGSLMYA